VIIRYPPPTSTIWRPWLGGLVARPELVEESARLVDIGEVQHLANALGFQWRIGREQKRFDDVS